MKPLGVDIVKDVQDKVRTIQTKILVIKSRQKKYKDYKVRGMKFRTGKKFSS